MPVRSYQIPGGARVALFTCETCGAEANYGYGVRLMDSLRLKDPRLAGKWFCKAHRPDNEIETSSAHPAPATQEMHDAKRYEAGAGDPVDLLGH